MSSSNPQLILLAYISDKPYFLAIKVKVLKEFSFKSNKKDVADSVYGFLRELSDSNIAFGFLHEGKLYFVGDNEKLLEKLDDLIQKHPNDIVIKKEIETETIKPLESPQHDLIFRVIFYSALRGNFNEKISKAYYGTVRKRGYFEIFLKEQTKSLYRDPTRKIFIHYGLKFFLELQTNGYGILWVDMVAPPISYDYNTRKCSRISVDEIPTQKARKEYRKYAVPNSAGRQKKYFRY